MVIVCAELASSLDAAEPTGSYTAESVVYRFAAFNAHASFTVNGHTDPATEPGARKWLTRDPTSAHWYRPDDFRVLIAGYLQASPAMTVRTLVKSFDGLSGTAKQRHVTEAAGLTRATLADLVDGRDIGTAADRLLDAMQAASKPVKPARLGTLGSAHLTATAASFGMEHCRYKRITFDAPGNPVVVELAFSYTEQETGNRRMVMSGVNFTPTLHAPPLPAVDAALSACLVSAHDPVMVFVHITAPRVQFTDTGKTRAVLPADVASGIETALAALGKPWLRLARQRDRDGRAHAKAIARLVDTPTAVTIKDAAWSVMGEAYAKASGNGQYPANARQIMYAARPAILRLTGEGELSDVYFTQTLLPNFMTAHPEIVSGWDVVYDDRGHFTEPHTGRVFGLGTIAVRDYLAGADPVDDELIVRPMTHGAACRYRAVLFIEKEGFMPLLRAARIPERFDLAVMSTKGVSNTSSRRLIESLSNDGVTVYVLHDFDKAGFTIAHTLGTDTRRYQFQSTPRIVDLGLRLADCAGLESEPVRYTSTVDPRHDLRASGATGDEADVLVSGGGPKRWTGQRVELNAMTSVQLVAWIETKLVEHGVGKFVPDEAVMRETFEALLRRRLLADRVRVIRDEVSALDLADAVPDGLADRVAAELIDRPALAWDDALDELATTRP